METLSHSLVQPLKRAKHIADSNLKGYKNKAFNKKKSKWKNKHI